MLFYFIITVARKISSHTPTCAYINSAIEKRKRVTYVSLSKMKPILKSAEDGVNLTVDQFFEYVIAPVGGDTHVVVAWCHFCFWIPQGHPRDMM